MMAPEPELEQIAVHTVDFPASTREIWISIESSTSVNICETLLGMICEGSARLKFQQDTKPWQLIHDEEPQSLQPIAILLN